MSIRWLLVAVVLRLPIPYSSLATPTPCPVSDAINTSASGVLSYPDIYFTREELEGLGSSGPSYPCGNRKGHLELNCTQGLCPLRQGDLDSARAPGMSWAQDVVGPLCASLGEGNATVRVFVLGGSMTLGRHVAGTCCRDETCSADFCAWSGFLVRWLREHFPHKEFVSYLFARGGTNSYAMVMQRSFEELPSDIAGS